MLRPDWTLGDNVEVEGKLRGIWFDSGTNITVDDGRHDCSPATVADENLAVAAARHGLSATVVGNDPPPIDGALWAIPHDDNPDSGTMYDDGPSAFESTGQIPPRLLQRTVPEFTSN